MPQAWGAFLTKIWRLDHDEKICRVLGKRQNRVLKLIEDKYLSLAFWERGESATPKVKKELRDAITRFRTRRMLWVFQLLFERLYVMRVQLFHGASTKGSKHNRRALQDSGIILPELLREFLSIMIDRGMNEEWGELCFPPDP